MLPVVPATAEEQLAVLNLNYAPKHEGFGVGNVDMRQYRSELRRAFTDVLGSECVLSSIQLKQKTEGVLVQSV